MILQPAAGRILPMSDEAIARTRRLEAIMRAHPEREIDIATDHVLHGGMYSRTIRIPAGVLLVGVLIRVPTLLIFDGAVTFNAGDEPVTLVGRGVLAASAGRRQAFFAHEDTALTMVFATDARTVAEAEQQFTDEADLLFSRRSGAINRITITGE